MAPNARTGLRRGIPNTTHRKLNHRIALIFWHNRRLEGMFVVTVADTALKFEFNGVDLMLTGERRIAMT